MLTYLLKSLIKSIEYNFENFVKYKINGMVF